MRKIVATAILCCLLLPGLVAAAPKSTTKPNAPSVKEALASWVHDLLKSVRQAATLIPPPKVLPTTDGRCTIDPNGSCTP